MIDRKEIKAGLPWGSQRKIAQRAGATETTVSQWFAGRFNSARLEAAALEVYAEAAAERNRAAARFEAAKRGEKL